MNVVQLTDIQLELEARKAARAHDSEQFAPLLDEVLRRGLHVDTTVLFNELYPPIQRSRYYPVVPKNHPSRQKARR